MRALTHRRSVNGDWEEGCVSDLPPVVRWGSEGSWRCNVTTCGRAAAGRGEEDRVVTFTPWWRLTVAWWRLCSDMYVELFLTWSCMKPLKARKELLFFFYDIVLEWMKEHRPTDSSDCVRADHLLLCFIPKLCLSTVECSSWRILQSKPQLCNI